MALPTAIEQMRARGPRGPRLPELGNVAPLPEFAARLAPEPVREASEEFGAKLDQLDQARADARAAADAVEAAEWADREAAREAAASGKAPPKASAPKARARREEAERGIPAAEWIAREALDRYLAAVRDHRDEIDAAAAENETALAAVLLRRVDEIEDALLRLAEVRALRTELETPPAGRHPVFGVRPPRRLASDEAKAIEALRIRLGGQ